MTHTEYAMNVFACVLLAFASVVFATACYIYYIDVKKPTDNEMESERQALRIEETERVIETALRGE